MSRFFTSRCAAVTALAGLAALAVVPAVSAAELLVNPGFEDTNSDNNYGDGWGSFGAAGFNQFFGPGNAHASLFDDQVGNSGGIYQLGIAGTGGTSYVFSLTDTLIEPRARAALSFGFEFYGADDATQISNAFQSIDLSNQAVNHGGGLVFTTSAAAPAGTAFVRPVVKFDSSNPFLGNGGPNIFVFAASMSVAPEPVSLLVLSGGAGLLAVRRRR